MEYIEEEDKNVEEAIKKSLDKLGIPFEQTHIEVSRSSHADSEAVVRVDPRDEKYIVKDLVENMLKKMDVQAEVWVSGDDGEYQANIRTRGLNGLLIGKKGETLLALQHILRRMLQRKLPEAKLIVDISNYRRRRDDRIVRRAKELAESAKITGDEKSIEFLNAYERWLIHTALGSDPDVVTHTEGEGTHKRVIITPRKK